MAKPKVGERYASGRLKPNCSFGPAPTAIKRAVEAALRGAGDPRWGSTIGRLRLEGVIVDRQLGAAESYGRLRAGFDRAMGMPRRSTASVFYDIGSPGRQTPRDLDEDELNRVRIDHARMLAEVGPLRTVLDRVVLFDDAPLPGEQGQARSTRGMVQDRRGVMCRLNTSRRWLVARRNFLRYVSVMRPAQHKALAALVGAKRQEADDERAEKRDPESGCEGCGSDRKGRP